MQRSVAIAHLIDGEFWVNDAESIRICWQSLMGFGKGNLSRSEPLFAQVVRGQVNVSTLGKAVRSMVRSGALQDSKIDPDVEHLHLAHYEAAYLVLDERVLHVMGWDEDNDVWNGCRRLSGEFAHQYAAYRAYRLAGWAPHSGCKYGADFVLYRFQSSQSRHVHAPFTVVVRSHDEPAERRWIAVQNQLRMTKQVAKKLVFIEVDSSSVRDHEDDRPRWLEGVQLREMVMDRWTADNKRGKNVE